MLGRRRAGRLQVLLVIAGLFVLNAWRLQGTAPPERQFRPTGGISTMLREDGTVNYAAYAELLPRYVSHEGGIDIDHLRVNGVEDLDPVLREMAQIDPTRLASLAETLAYSVNLTNMLVLYGLATVPRTDVVYVGQWSTLTFRGRGMDEEVTVWTLLDDVIPAARDPRLFLAVSKGTISGGRLHWQPYVGERLDEQLTANTVAFLEDQANFLVSHDGRQVRISPWLGELAARFDWSEDSLLRFCTSHSGFTFDELADYHLEVMDFSAAPRVIEPQKP